MKLAPWCRPVLECEGFILLEDGWSTVRHTPASGQGPLYLQTRVFHLANSRLHIHITMGPCFCAGGHALVKVDVTYRWRSLPAHSSSYAVPRELWLPAGHREVRMSLPGFSHNPLLHVASWTQGEHLPSAEAFKKLSIEWDGKVVYNLRLTMQAHQSGISFFSIVVLDAKSETRNSKDQPPNSHLEQDQPPDVDLEQEAMSEMAWAYGYSITTA